MGRLSEPAVEQPADAPPVPGLWDATVDPSGSAHPREPRSVTVSQSKVAEKIDSLMEHASEALVGRRYFECERVAADALRRAVAAHDFDRAARIILPLQEARRQIRDLAVDTGRVTLVRGETPSGAALQPGMYLVTPPRVGVDGRLIREEAHRREVPAVIIVREPMTRDGLWPIVAVGPVTVRTKVPPPPGAAPPLPLPDGVGTKPKRAPRRTKGSPSPAAPPDAPSEPLPPPQWFLQAAEALGDAAIAQVAPHLTPVVKVLAYMDRLEAVPDHEKLHQRLEEATRDAARMRHKPRRVHLGAPAGDPLESENGNPEN